MSVSAWEAIFMLVVLKIPVVYLAAVVWWAVRSGPEVEGGADEIGVLSPLTPCGWDDWKRRRARWNNRRSLRPSGVRMRARAGLS